MSRFTSSLDNIRIASPCRANWDEMIGGNRVRFCSQCSLNVYNLSSLSRQEAESLIASTEGHLCVRFYRRVDGSVLTKNCPIGLKEIRKRMSRLAQAVGSALLTFVAGMGLVRLASFPEIRSDAIPPVTGEVVSEVKPDSGLEIMGGIAVKMIP